MYRGSGKSRVTVRVRFRPNAARFVTEKEWHASKELATQTDGSELAIFRLSATEEIKSWLLGFGASAHLLALESLRNEIVRELETMLDRYQGEDSKAKPKPR